MLSLGHWAGTRFDVDSATWASIVGDFGMFTRGSGLAFDLAGTLWSAGRADSGVASVLHTINPATGA